MTALLPPNLLRLFAPRDPVPYLRPLTKDDADRGPDKLRGVGALVTRLKEEADAEEIKKGLDDSVVTQSETSAQAQASKDAVKTNGDGDVDMEGKPNGGASASASGSSGKQAKKRKEVKPKKMDKIAKLGVVGQEARVMRAEERAKRKAQYKKDQEKNYNPQDDENAVGDPYKTLFISRLSKKVTEDDLRREFEIYGNIERIRLVLDRKGHSKSYAFIVYERERDMKAAYKDAEGIPIHHKKILVDVERGRTVKGWKPQRLGHGLGGRPKPVKPEDQPPQDQFGGGFGGGRGGFRGGFGGGPGRGGFGGRGGFQGGGGGFGGRGGFQGGGGGGFGGGRGGFQGGPGGPGGGFGGRGGFGGPGGPGGPPGRGGFGGQDGGYGGRGGFGGGGGFRGGFQGGGGGFGQQGGFQNGGGMGGPGGAPGGGMGMGMGGGFKRDFDAPAGGGGGAYDDRDSKRMRY